MKQCIACGAKLLEKPLLVLDNMPASAQDIPTIKEIEHDKGIQLCLRECSGCGLVQIDGDPVWYYKDVIRAGGFTTTMTDLRKRQYSAFVENYKLEGKKILEVGAGQGEFLEMLSGFNVQAYGIEHRKELALSAQAKGLRVTNEFAENEKTRLQYAPFDAFLSFNFLEHQPNPNGMLRAVFQNTTEEAVGIITVPSWEYIMQYDGFYELVRDHLAYYTFETLEFLLKKNGFEVLEREVINRDTLSVTVGKRTAGYTNELKKGFDSLNNEIAGYIKNLKKQDKKLCLWGAGHQGFTIAACTQLKDFAEYMIDSAPFKQGKYAPASHIAIVSPDYFKKQPVDVILIVAPGYTNEIANVIREQFGEDVEIVVLKSDHLEAFTSNSEVTAK